MDLTVPRFAEEAQEIQQGQLKFGYFTNFVRLGTDLSPFLMRDPKIVILLQRKAVA